jgi:hypothetical protein
MAMVLVANLEAEVARSYMVGSYVVVVMIVGVSSESRSATVKIILAWV